MYEFDWSSILPALPYLWQGMQITLEITGIAFCAAIILGTFIGVMRLSTNRWISGFAATYITLFRSIPLVMVLLWFFLALGPTLLSNFLGLIVRDPQFLTAWRFFVACLAFSLFEASYYAEIIRAGIQSVSKGQMMAGFALGLDFRQTMLRIILPQAFRRMTPLILTQMIVLFQDSSLVYVMAVTDFFGVAYNTGTRDGTIVEMLLFAGAVYFAISFIASTLVRRFQRRFST
jgi:glutamate/aspartate transport system permease protein